MDVRAKCLAVLCVLCLAASVEARTGAPPASRTRNLKPVTEVEPWVVPGIDARKALADASKEDKPLPVKIAEPFDTQVEVLSLGTWEMLPDGGQVWRLHVQCEGATDLNFGFSQFELPEGATLHIVSPDHDYCQGPYTSRDNKPHGQFWSPVVPGDNAILEVYLPAGVDRWPTLVLSRVGRGFRNLFKIGTAAEKAGACNIDVICPDGDGWRDDIRSVAVYTVGGTWTCSGTLIMNARRDFKDYFLTANHCGVGVAEAMSVVVYWNFESPSCGALGGGSLADNQSGAIFRAAKFEEDFCLLELEDEPAASFNVYYAGWDRSGGSPTGAVAIHHPNTDEKAISFCTNVLVADRYLGTDGTVNHWKIPKWFKGTTEPGSSGSGLWDARAHLLVGQLHGGYAACTDTNASDWYGQFSESWDAGAAATNRLQNWLDPDNTATMRVYGANTGAKLPNAALTFPAGGESITTGLLITVTWNSNAAPVATRGELEYTDQFSGDRPATFTDAVESGTNNWQRSHSGGTLDWNIVTTASHSPTHAWFATNQALVASMYLMRTGIVVTSGGAVFSFWHWYNLETGFDGGVIEVSTNGAAGPWADLGNASIENGYTYVISGGYSSPIAGRGAFSGNSGGFIRTRVSLRDYVGRTVAIRFLLASDSSANVAGWWVDDFELYSAQLWYDAGANVAPATDLDWQVPGVPGTDYCLRVRQSGSGYKASNRTTGSVFRVVVGGVSDDADGDGLSDAYEAAYSGGGSATRLLPGIDQDDDGYDNLAEFIAYTHPGDPQSYPRLTSMGFSLNHKIEFASTNLRQYAVYYSTNLMGPTWTLLQGGITGSNGVTTVADPGPPASRRFYRMGVSE